MKRKDASDIFAEFYDMGWTTFLISPHAVSFLSSFVSLHVSGWLGVGVFYLLWTGHGGKSTKRERFRRTGDGFGEVVDGAGWRGVGEGAG